MENQFSLLDTKEYDDSAAHEVLLIKKYDFNQFVDRLKFLYHCLTTPSKDYRAQCRVYLRAGCQIFDMEGGFISAAIGPFFKLAVSFEGGKDDFHSELTEQDRLICDAVMKKLESVEDGEENCVQSGYVSYNNYDRRHYVAVPIIVSGNQCGVLCFSTGSDSFPQTTSFDKETLELMAEGVARMIEIQNTQEKNRIEEIRGFATAGVKTLEEYVSMARLPEVYGVSGRVVDVLQRRVGHLPLAIDYIADELNLSKRTLQRRLQQQNISFAQLRDQVRFHFSIDYLVHQTLSIDAISAALDFSDRTSFTNAFKRWTSLSPSTFRKLFRDYA